MEQKIKTGVLIGAGMVAKTHILACAALSDRMRLKGIAARRFDRVEALIAQSASLFEDGLVAYRSFDDLLRDETVDFAIIATPPNVRTSLIEPLARRGKHILLEKPMARTTHEAKQLVEICRHHQVTLGIVFQHRTRAASRYAHQLVSSGQLGSLGLCEITVPWWRPQSYYDEIGRGTLARDGGGVLLTQAIHTVDLALSLTGAVAQVRAMATTTRFHEMETEDFVCASLQFTSGAVGSLIASTASFPGSAEQITLHFDQASLRLTGGLLQVDWRDGRTEHFGEVASGTGGGADPMAFTHEWHQEIIDDFIGALNEKRAPLISGEETLHVHHLIDAILASARDGQVTPVS